MEATNHPTMRKNQRAKERLLQERTGPEGIEDVFR